MCRRARPFKSTASARSPSCQNRPNMKGYFVTLASLLIGAAALAAQRGPAGPDARTPTSGMNEIAESYVKLVLALGQHDADYVDAYYGPAEWKQQAESAKAPLADLAGRARTLLERVTRLSPPAGEMERLRHQYLERQLSAVNARIRMLLGERM